MTDNQKQDVIKAIAYSRLVSQTFSVSECILLHQWHNGQMAISKSLETKYKEVHNHIKKSNWIKPKLTYVDGGELYQGFQGTPSYKKIN